MPNMNKKALSSVVSTMLIVLLAIASVSILAVAVNRFIKNDIQLSPKLSCIDLQTSGIAIKSACYNSSSNSIQTAIFRPLSETEISSIDFTITTDSNSKKFQCGLSCGSCSLLSSGETRLYTIPTQEKPSKVSISTFSCILDSKEVGDC